MYYLYGTLSTRKTDKKKIPSLCRRVDLLSSRRSSGFRFPPPPDAAIQFVYFMYESFPGGTFMFALRPLNRRHAFDFGTKRIYYVLTGSGPEQTALCSGAQITRADSQWKQNPGRDLHAAKNFTQKPNDWMLVDTLDGSFISA